MIQTILGALLFGGAMFGLGFLLCMWLVFDVAWIGGEDEPTATSYTFPRVR